MELIYYDMKKIKEENQRQGSTDWQATSHDRKSYLQSQQLELINPLLQNGKIIQFFYDLQVLAVMSVTSFSRSIIVYETITDKFNKLIEINIANLQLPNTKQLGFDIKPPKVSTDDYQIVVNVDNGNDNQHFRRYAFNTT